MTKSNKTKLIIVTGLAVLFVVYGWIYDTQQKRKLEKFINSPEGKALTVKCLQQLVGNPILKAKLDEFESSELAKLDSEGQGIFKYTLSRSVNFEISNAYFDVLTNPDYQNFEYKLAIAKEIVKRNRRFWQRLLM